MTSILAVISNLFSLFKLIKELTGLWRQAQREGWLNESTVTLDQLEKAKSDEERKALAKRLAELGIFPRG